MPVRTWPVLQSFEKDQARQNFVINQIAGGLNSAVGGTGNIVSLRERLSAARTYFVATTGNDSNDGLAASTAFLTIQKALNVVYGTLDLGGFNITIQVADGTYNQSLLINSPQVGNGVVTINGNAVTPGSVIVTSSTGNTLTAANYAVVSIANLQIQSSNSHALLAFAGGIIRFNTGIRFGTTTAFHMAGQTTGLIDAPQSAYSIVGNAQYHIVTLNTGLVEITSSTITIPAGLAFLGFTLTQQVGSISASGLTFKDGVGAIPGVGFTATTGQRYNAKSNGVIFTAGAGANYFPGNVAGVVDAFGGQYV